VSLIQDEYLEPVAGRSKDCALAKIAGIVNSIVAGRVNFDYVE
jgi:hypothetical protein